MFGLFGIGNFGNEATLDAALEATARVLPDARVWAICADPRRVEAEHGVPALQMSPSGRLGRLAAGGRVRRRVVRPLLEIGRLVFAIHHLRRVDLVVVPGTGILDDYGQTPTQLPLDVARWSAAARIARARLIYLSIGAGPIVHPVSRRLMRFAVGRAAFCSYRDEGSRRFMESIGRETAADEVWPDVVFALDRETGVSRDDERPFTVALGVMNYRGWGGSSIDTHDRYVDRMVDLASRLRRAGHELRLVIGEDTDLPVARTVARRLGDPAVDVVQVAGLDGVCAAVANTDVLVASRYHNLVAALIAGVPAISLSYADKNDQLLDSFELGEYCQPIENFDPGLVLEHIETIRADHKALTAGIRRRVAATRAEIRGRLDAQLAAPRNCE
jgi:polysaccharide pyruvyl transferase WcaK-like protein